MSTELGRFSLDRMVRAAEKVRERLLRAAGTIEQWGIPYAVVGDCAVAFWVGRVVESVVRNARDVEILVRRDDFQWTAFVLTNAGFVHRPSSDIVTFLDGPDARAREAVQIVFASETALPGEAGWTPDPTESVETGEIHVLSLQALILSKLTAFRDKDRKHLRDLIEVGLIDAHSADDLPEGLAERLRILIENPEG
jgi:hypothetical protein